MEILAILVILTLVAVFALGVGLVAAIVGLFFKLLWLVFKLVALVVGGVLHVIVLLIAGVLGFVFNAGLLTALILLGVFGLLAVRNLGRRDRRNPLSREESDLSARIRRNMARMEERMRNLETILTDRR